MKKSVIREIFHGKRGQMETMQVFSEAYQEAANERCDAYDAMKEKFDPEQLELQQKFSDAQDDVWYEEVNYYFVEGFKLGVLIGIECMEE